MSLPNLFNKEVSESIIDRINHLSPDKNGLWGKMTVAQMLAHCSVTYEMIYDNIHKKPNSVMRFILKKFVKKTVVEEGPYKKNSQTAPAFLMKETKVFDVEKKRLIDYIRKTQELGESYFQNRESHSFGVLTIQEWNTMFYKHLDHHLSQFGV